MAFLCKLPDTQGMKATSRCGLQIDFFFFKGAETGLSPFTWLVEQEALPPQLPPDLYVVLNLYPDRVSSPNIGEVILGLFLNLGSDSILNRRTVQNVHYSSFYNKISDAKKSA